MIYYVILHYQVLDETVACVDSILKLYNSEEIPFKVVIVDNASPNGSGEQLKKIYEQETRVEVLLNKENAGFARGNNVGYRYAKEAGAEFIVQVNNDTIFEDAGFLRKIKDIYAKESYAVLGPDIRSMYEDEHQNPMKGFPITRRNVNVKLIKNYIGVMLAHFNLDNLVKGKPGENTAWKESRGIIEGTNLTLQGCCFIFSPIYIKQFDGMYDKTFMYYEEDILKYLCLKLDMKMYYSRELYLLHKRSVSTSFQKSKRKSRIFKYRQSINSLKQLKGILDK